MAGIVQMTITISLKKMGKKARYMGFLAKAIAIYAEKRTGHYD